MKTICLQKLLCCSTRGSLGMLWLGRRMSSRHRQGGEHQTACCSQTVQAGNGGIWFSHIQKLLWELRASAALLQSVLPMGDGMRNWHLALTWTSSRGIQLVRALIAAQIGPRACTSSAWGLGFQRVFPLLGHWMFVMFMSVQGRMWC